VACEEQVEVEVYVDEMVRNRLRSLRVRMGMAGSLIAGNGRNQRVLLPELPSDRRTGYAWAVRNMRLRCCNASAWLSPDLFGRGRLLYQGEADPA
jgi:hypothetical protein